MKPLELAKEAQKVHAKNVENWRYGKIVDYLEGRDGGIFVRYAYGGWWWYQVYWSEEFQEAICEWVSVS